MALLSYDGNKTFSFVDEGEDTALIIVTCTGTTASGAAIPGAINRSPIALKKILVLAQYQDASNLALTMPISSASGNDFSQEVQVWANNLNLGAPGGVSNGILVSAL